MSITYIGALVQLLGFLSAATGVQLPYTSEQVTAACEVVIGLIGFGITIYGRFRHGPRGTPKTGRAWTPENRPTR